MKKKRLDTTDLWSSIETPLLGYAVLVLELVCFLLFLIILMVLTRAVAG